MKFHSFIVAALVHVIIFACCSNSEPCPNLCSSHGRCFSPGKQCECFEGFTGADCSERVCAFGKAWVDQATGVDQAHNQAECSNMGICDRETGLCTCREGFEGTACERQSCPDQCNGLGECQSMYYYALTKDPGTGTVHKYDKQWDAFKIYGCNCDRNYYGSDCSLRYCPKGDDPLTGTDLISPKNPLQFNEIQQVSCKADGGTFTLSFRGKTTRRIAYNAQASEIVSAIEELPTLGKGSIKLVMNGAQACFDYGTSWTIEFLQHFGNLPLMVPDDRFLQFTNSLSTATLTVAKIIVGTKENEECSNRGICDSSSGVCMCANDFDTSNGYNAAGTRGDCGFATQGIQYCPGPIACSAHGECLDNPTYRCRCSNGWTGADCSERLCPTGLAWFQLPEDDNVAHVSTYTECSSAGICDRSTGLCDCDTVFTGASCNRVSCPGASDDTDGCSGHGKCLDMQSLAALSTINGDLAGFTYGNIPNNPVTWDADRIFGCYCDDGYMGYDCSLLVCPSGDDPDTRTQLDEQQYIDCTDADGSGNIVFTFRQQDSASVSPIATTAQVKAALEALSSIGEVAVETFVDGATDSLCAPSGSRFVVTFLTEHGDLPMIQFTTSNVDSFSIVENVKGTKEVLECAGRGLCDHSVGECQCFPGYGSSDGKGGAGSLRDCGYREPIIGRVEDH